MKKRLFKCLTFLFKKKIFFLFSIKKHQVLLGRSSVDHLTIISIFSISTIYSFKLFYSFNLFY
jgi:hypothetical protein